MRRFLYCWLAMIAAMFVSLGFAGLATLVATVAERYSNQWIGLGVMLLVISAITAAGMVWASGPTSQWFQKLYTRLSDQ